MPTKPAWVEALDEAKKLLTAAANQDLSEQRDSLTRLAYAWMDIARMQKAPDATE